MNHEDAKIAKKSTKLDLFLSVFTAQEKTPTLRALSALAVPNKRTEV